MLLLLLVLIVGLVLVYQKLGAVTARMQALEHRLRQLEGGAAPLEKPAAGPTWPGTAVRESPLLSAAPVPAAVTDIPATPAAVPSTPSASATAEDIETAIGSRWMLVVGTVVLVIGVAFFVKYAFDNDWINETARIVIGTVVGLLVWAAGLRLSAAGYPLYGQVIAGGGLAMVYITAFAAHALYDLVPTGVAFAWMAAASAVTLVTADRQRSVGLALMAVVLAYLAPLLLGSEGSHLAFFGYNLALGGLTLVLTWRHGWPLLGFASLYLAVMTTGAWASRSYTPDLYLSTEIYLAIAFVVFMAVMRAQRQAQRLAARAAGFVTTLLPAGFHAASLGVLFPHSVALLLYLVGATTAAVAIPDVRASARVRLVVWASTALPFYAWLLEHTSGVWYIPAVATALGLYTLHLMTQFLMMSDTDRPPNAEILLFHANGLSLFLFLYVTVDANAGSTALVAAEFAAWNGLLAYGSRHRVAEGTAQSLALAFAMAATAVALAFVGPWITVGWAAEGAAVVWVGLAMRRPLLRGGGVALLTLASMRLAVYQLPVTLAGHQPVLNLRVATAAFIIGSIYAVAALYRRAPAVTGRERRLAIDIAVVAANVLTLLLITAEIVSFWTLRAEALSVTFARPLSISLAWALYALGLIVLGFRRQSSLLRYMALALFGVTVLKIFSVDLLALQGIYRIVGFVALGVILLGASFLYQRSVSQRR